MTQHHDPVHPEPGDLEPVPHLSAVDERFVTDLLAGLGSVAMPADVVARVEQALAAERSATEKAAAPAAAPAAPATATVTPLTGRRRWASPRLLQAAAAVVLVGGGLVVAVNVLGSGGAGSGGTAAGLDSGGRSAGAPEVASAAITTSGQRYTAAGLATQVTDLLDGPATSLTAPADAAALVRDQDRLASCLAALEQGLTEAVVPVAVDAGSYEARPAVVVVLPALDPARLDVFVVEPACSVADARLIVFRSIVRP